MSTEPWKAAAPLPDSRSDQPGNRRYKRAVALSDMARKLAGRLATVPRYAASVQHWRFCIEHWEDYLDGKIDPPTGRKMRHDE